MKSLEGSRGYTDLQERRKSLQEGVLRGTEGCVQAKYRSMGSQPEFSKLHWLIQM